MSYISRITCQEGFCILILADDLPLNDYATLKFFTEFSDFLQITDDWTLYSHGSHGFTRFVTW